MPGLSWPPCWSCLTSRGLGPERVSIPALPRSPSGVSLRRGGNWRGSMTPRISLMETHMMNDPEFDRLLAEAVAAPFAGWDFSWLEGRRVEEEDRETAWDYEERVLKRVQSAASLLDVGTGGGERWSRLEQFP